LEKKVAICSPAILLVIIDQLRSWNKTWEQYKELDKITSDIAKFWDNLELFKKRWEKIIQTIESNNENIRKFNISTKKLIEGGEKIKNRENTLSEIQPKSVTIVDNLLKEEN
jgi:DNA anti-recombination protein RmuC